MYMFFVCFFELNFSGIDTNLFYQYYGACTYMLLGIMFAIENGLVMIRSPFPNENVV